MEGGWKSNQIKIYKCIMKQVSKKKPKCQIKKGVLCRIAFKIKNKWSKCTFFWSLPWLLSLIFVFEIFKISKGENFFK